MTRRESILTLVSAGVASGASSVDTAYERATVIDTMSPGGAVFEPDTAIEAGITALVADLPIFPRNYPNALNAMADWKSAFEKEPKFLQVLTGADLAKATTFSPRRLRPALVFSRKESPTAFRSLCVNCSTRRPFLWKFRKISRL